MERAINVIVKVNNEAHALLIRNELTEVVQRRTTIFFVGIPVKPDRTIMELCPLPDDPQPADRKGGG